MFPFFFFPVSPLIHFLIWPISQSISITSHCIFSIGLQCICFNPNISYISCLCLAVFISSLSFPFLPSNVILQVFQSTVGSPPKSSSCSTLWRDQSGHHCESSLSMTLRSFWMVSWPESNYIASIKSINHKRSIPSLCAMIRILIRDLSTWRLRSIQMPLLFFWAL